MAVGDESYLPRLERRGDLLLSVSMQPFAVHRESFEQPELLCASVPGWREARVLHDPEGLAVSLIRRAGEWSWGPLERRCDEWVAGEITARAETVHKLMAALNGRRGSVAASKRSILALHLAPVLAVHHRILYGGENRLWSLVSGAMGEEWRRKQAAAMGQNGESFVETCAAALELYGIAASETEYLLDERQREVVGQARALADQSASL